MNVKPLGERVVIDVTPKAKISAGGIHIPDIWEDTPDTGTVVAVGEGYMRKDGTYTPLTCKVGDRVIYERYIPIEIQVGDSSYVVTKETNVIAIVEG